MKEFKTGVCSHGKRSLKEEGKWVSCLAEHAVLYVLNTKHSETWAEMPHYSPSGRHSKAEDYMGI